MVRNGSRCVPDCTCRSTPPSGAPAGQLIKGGASGAAAAGFICSALEPEGALCAYSIPANSRRAADLGNLMARLLVYRPPRAWVGSGVKFTLRRACVCVSRGTMAERSGAALHCKMSAAVPGFRDNRASIVRFGPSHSFGGCNSEVILPSNLTGRISNGQHVTLGPVEVAGNERAQ